MPSFTIAGIGEILWDVLENSEELGGAPVNFAYHAQALGAKSYPISTIGDDARGHNALLELQKRHVSCDYITTIKNGITGYVQAHVDAEGVASYQFPDNVAWDSIYLRDDIHLLAKELDAVCFGSLAQRSPHSRTVIHDFLRSTGTATLKVFDLNIRQQFFTREIIVESLILADVLKLNDDEITLIAEIENLHGEPLDQMQELVKRYGLQLGVLTRGGQGSLLVTPSDYSDHQGFPTSIVNTIGAGDSFTAATVLGFLQGHSLYQINQHANRVAAYVCSQKGAMPILPENLRIL